MRFLRNSLLALVVTLGAVGCDSGTTDGWSPPATIPTTGPTVPSTPITADSDWVEALISDARQGGAADTSVLTSEQFGELDSELPNLACCIESVAGQFDAVNSAWGITPSIVKQFLSDWCYAGVSQSVGRLFATIPGADLRALPALNQTLSLIRRTCDYDPTKLDWTSGRFLNFTTGNQLSSSVRPVPAPPKRSSAMRATFTAICSGLNSGLTGWVAKRLRGGKGNFFLTIAMEAAFTFCPDAMDRVLPR